MSKANPTVDVNTAKTGAVPELLDVDSVARVLNCSQRHVYRLADTGRMPPAVKLGALIRWQRQAVLDWIAAGCPRVRNTKGGRP